MKSGKSAPSARVSLNEVLQSLHEGVSVVVEMVWLLAIVPVAVAPTYAKRGKS